LVVARAERYFFKWIAGTPVSARREYGAGPVTRRQNEIHPTRGFPILVAHVRDDIPREIVGSTCRLCFKDLVAMTTEVDCD